MKKKNVIVLAIAVVLIIVAGVIACVTAAKFSSTNEGNETIPDDTNQALSLDIGTDGVISVTDGVNTAKKIKLCFSYKTESGFKETEFSGHVSTNLEAAEPFSLDIKKQEDRERKFIQPEVRLYGVNLDANVTVTVESQATKAYKENVGINDGAYQYFYWQPRLYDYSEQGEYTFKVTIQESEESAEEQVIYYKISV